MHQGSALETFGDIAVSFEEAGSSIPKELHADIEQQAFQLDGSNACTFFATTLAHNLKILAMSENNNTLNSKNELMDFVETLITDLPKKINQIRDVSSYVTVEEAVGILKEASVSDLSTEILMNCFSGLKWYYDENRTFPF